MPAKGWLIGGSLLSGAAAALHVAIIFGGSAWYRFFGAGERMARAAEWGSLRPLIITLVIVMLLLIASAYALSGAGALRRLPLLRTGLVTISLVYLVRALAPLPILLFRPESMSSFVLWSSLIVLAYGLVHAIGTWKAWPTLAPPA